LALSREPGPAFGGKETLWWSRGEPNVLTLRAIAFRYELLDAGRRLRATEQVRGSDHDQDNTWMFERR
jgi:hypothetical protein